MLPLTASIQRSSPMNDEEKTREQLLEELAALRDRVAELEHQVNVTEQRVEERTAALQESNDQVVAEVVERRQAEKRLQATRDQFEAVLEVVPGIVSWVSADLKYLGVNQCLAETFGLSPDAFIGQDIGFLGVSPEFNQFVQDFFASNETAASREVTADLGGENRNYLIVAQKYDHDRAAFTVGIDITKRRRAEANLQTTKEQLEAVLEAVPGIVSWISADLKYLGVNRHLAEMLNLPREAFVGQDIGFLGTSSEFNHFVQDFFASPDRETVREVSAIIQGEPRNYLIIMQKYNQDQAAFTIGLDITERRQAEEGLRATKEQLEAILEAVPGIVSWVSEDLRYLGVNRYLAETFQVPREAFVGQDIGFLGSSSEFGDFIQNFFQSPDQDTSREVHAFVNGEERHYRIVAQKYDQGRAAFVIGLDISDRYQAEQALKDAESKYRSIFENAIEGIFQTTPEGRYISANPALARMYGYASPQDLMANLTDIGEQLYVDPKRRAAFVQKMQERDAVVLFESQIRRRDGTCLWIAENARAVKDESGKVLYYEGTVEDITERKQIQEILEHTNEELEKRVEDRTAALRDTNHRLRLEIIERELVEAALRDSEAEIRALFAAMTDVIAVFDKEGRFQKLVTTNTRLLHRPEIDRIGKTVFEVLPPKQASLFYATVQRALAIQGTVSLEYTLPIGDPATSNGQQDMWFTANVSPITQDTVVWVARDITERKQAEQALRAEQQKSEQLLANILPMPIVEQLKQNQRSILEGHLVRGVIAERVESATILFADIVNFTGLVSRTTPNAMLGMLDRIFSTFDQLAEEYGLEKIKTIGDAYMVAGGIPHAQPDHVKAMACMALAMRDSIRHFGRATDERFQLRIGLHTGPVIAGVIGIKKFAYDLWGDTVNIASRMESHGEAGRIQVTEAIYHILEDSYQFECRGAIDIKGIGTMTTYWLVGEKPPS